jgi:hypothetical protein
MDQTTCKRCHQTFTPERAGAQYCSPRCRVAAHRKRRLVVPSPRWLSPNREQLATISRTFNTDGTLALSEEELADHLLEIAQRDDSGKPKTGRRYWYLALSHGHIQPDMGASDVAKASRSRAQKRIAKVLGLMRKTGMLGWNMVLDLTRELDEWQTFDSPREARAAMRRRYDEDRWIGQWRFPILIVEKDTIGMPQSR